MSSDDIGSVPDPKKMGHYKPGPCEINLN